jgi:2-polyprenyl-6-methoxyphenol hydroxylase-like FAD-dependent oxidoreductase
MRSLSVAVLGAGTAGLSAALALARDGHRVTLVERDPLPIGAATDALAWPRRGISHFQQPHAFIPRGRKEMRTFFPDVFAALVDAGAWDVDLRPKIRGDARAEDEELAYFAARRPLIEWALRRAALDEPDVRVMSGATATGYVADAGDPPRVTGVLTTDGPIRADLVIDAMGRRSASPAWIEAFRGRPQVERSSDCGVISGMARSRPSRVTTGRSRPCWRSLPATRS